MVLLLVAASVSLSAQSGAAPSIVGSYELLYRELADGKQVDAGAGLAGMMTYTKTHRNFNVMWKNEDSSITSVAYIAKYTLSSDSYCETPLYWMQSNLGEPGLSYTPPPEKADCSAVMLDSGTLVFAINGEPVVVAFEGDTITATASSQEGKMRFVDRWRRVD